MNAVFTTGPLDPHRDAAIAAVPAGEQHQELNAVHLGPGELVRGFARVIATPAAAGATQVYAEDGIEVVVVSPAEAEAPSDTKPRRRG